MRSFYHEISGMTWGPSIKESLEGTVESMLA